SWLQGVGDDGARVPGEPVHGAQCPELPGGPLVVVRAVVGSFDGDGSVEHVDGVSAAAAAAASAGSEADGVGVVEPEPIGRSLSVTPDAVAAGFPGVAGQVVVRTQDHTPASCSVLLAVGDLHGGVVQEDFAGAVLGGRLGPELDQKVRAGLEQGQQVVVPDGARGVIGERAGVGSEPASEPGDDLAPAGAPDVGGQRLGQVHRGGPVGDAGAGHIVVVVDLERHRGPVAGFGRGGVQNRHVVDALALGEGGLGQLGGDGGRTQTQE